MAGAARLASDARRGGRGTAHGSSFRADEAGLLGARLLLEELGHAVESRRGPHLPEGSGHVLVRVEGGPQHRRVVEPEERAAGAALRAWVERGNALLLFASRAPIAADLPPVRGSGPDDWKPVVPDEADIGDDLGENLEVLFGRDRADVPDADGEDLAVVEELRGVEPVAVTGRWTLEPGTGDVVLLRRAGDVVGLERNVGRGRTVVVADPWFLTNVRLANHPENAAFLAAVVERIAEGGDGAVWFDDRAAGQEASRGLLSLFQEIGLGPALAGGLVLLLLAAWRAAVSDAPDRFVRPDVQYHPEQLALQRGDLYASCLTPDEARRIVRDEVARRIGRGDGVGCDRALAMLAARDPERAARVRAALDALPRHPAVTPRRHPETWCLAVSEVWRALETPPAARPAPSTVQENA